MHIGDPGELKKIDGFISAYVENCRRNHLNHTDFIGPEDRFNFTCKRTDVCCKNFSSKDRILIEPYDVLRLSRRLRISTRKFMREYADLTLDHHTHFPVALLKYKGGSTRNKCHFLRSYGCSVYEDRPLRCRLYPLGRISNNGRSYFIHINNCPCGNSYDDKPWSAREWIYESRAEDYLEYQSYINDVYSLADWDAYKNLNNDIKFMLGEVLYNIEKLPEKISQTSRPISDKEIMFSLKRWLEGYLIEHGCLVPIHGTPKAVIFKAGPSRE